MNYIASGIKRQGILAVGRTNDLFERWSVYQQIYLVNRDAWYFEGNDAERVSLSAYPLSAQFYIDNAHYYIVHFHFGAYIRADGDTLLGTANSYINANINVSEIRLTYYV